MAWSVTADVLEFAEAIAWFRNRVAMTKAAYERLTALSKRKAFFIANVAQADLVKQAMAAVDKAVASGTSLDDFKNSIGPDLIKAWRDTVSDPAWRLETIFRNNVQRAYSAGRYQQATHPDVASDRPVWMFDAILDGRETEICKACDGTKLTSDDDWWKSHLPPLHHNCRSSFIALTDAQAGSLTKRPTPKVADEGFGDPPDTDPWTPDPANYPPKIQADLKRKLSAAPPTPSLDVIEGKHADKVDITKAVASKKALQKIADEALSSVNDAETLRFLEQHPLNRLRLEVQARSGGDDVNGFYETNRQTIRRISITVDRDRRTFGQPFIPGGEAGKVWSVSAGEKTRKRAVQATLRHELGHHVHMLDARGSKADSVVAAAFARASASGRFLTRYAKTDPDEYFAECYVAYYFRRSRLRSFDPNGFKMVEDVLRLRGILP